MVIQALGIFELDFIGHGRRVFRVAVISHPQGACAGNVADAISLD
jgi:hypothetical protein